MRKMRSSGIKLSARQPCGDAFVLHVPGSGWPPLKIRLYNELRFGVTRDLEKLGDYLDHPGTLRRGVPAPGFVIKTLWK